YRWSPGRWKTGSQEVLGKYKTIWSTILDHGGWNGGPRMAHPNRGWRGLVYSSCPGRWPRQCLCLLANIRCGALHPWDHGYENSYQKDVCCHALLEIYPPWLRSGSG